MKVIYTAFGLFVLLAVVIVVYGTREPTHSVLNSSPNSLTADSSPDLSSQANSPQAETVSSSDHFSQQLTHWQDQLIKAGWTKQAASAVLALNQEWFSLLYLTEKGFLDDLLFQLKSLKVSSALMSFLEKNPEMAALMINLDSDLTEFIKLVDYHKDCYAHFTSLFMFHSNRRDATALAQALSRNSDLICRLQEKHLLHSETLFIFPRDNPRDKEAIVIYEKWLRDVLETALRSDDSDELINQYQFLLQEGAKIRTFLIEDESFRDNFRDYFWPRLLRASEETGFSLVLYASDAHFWKVATIPEGEQFLKAWLWSLQVTGYTPAELLFKEHYPPAVLNRIEKALLEKNEILYPLVNLGKNPSFNRFLEKNLDYCTETSAIHKLNSDESRVDSLLNDWLKENDRDRLNAELCRQDRGGTFATVVRTAQGRHVSGVEALLVATDVIFTVVPIPGSGVVSKALSAGVKQVAKTQTKKAINKQMGKLMKKMPSVAGKAVKEIDLFEEGADIFLSEIMERSKAQLSQGIRLSHFSDIMKTQMKPNPDINASLPLAGILSTSSDAFLLNQGTFQMIEKGKVDLFMRKDEKATVSINSSFAKAGALILACSFLAYSNPVVANSDCYSQLEHRIDDKGRAIFTQLSEQRQQALDSSKAADLLVKKNNSVWWFTNSKAHLF
ncbi:hypothetical protein [Thioflexithrix psekupsensis]|uniref:Uncharacterized protein n=1 Tax=Thioflexithrix psekupsensis TaxID=1570016 RepID=A0A251X394_9GAMM|nr:hypothetical protein [Thioflexithrix psekupsensis]OUD11713.1 hypothetical protein TPSD3_16815 [Thioflexithrix psekupsensis]